MLEGTLVKIVAISLVQVKSSHMENESQRYDKKDESSTNSSSISDNNLNFSVKQNNQDDWDRNQNRPYPLY